MTIRVYNSLTRQKEVFENKGNRIGIYVCGVTPYSETHLGHARPSIIWDVIKKYLRYRGYKTFHVQNFTDIDDKIIARANAEGRDPLEVAAMFSHDYLASMDALGVERADLYPKVSEHIGDIISMIESLIAREHAYVVNGNVFFDVASFSDYGKLSNQKLDELQAGTRFEVDPDKKNPLDFALWKRVKPSEPAWESPWGKGRPGWHIECSAMSLKYLGNEFDFHGGGCDLIFPHHENEIAQSEGATGKPLARYWLHNGMLSIKQAKMSKSLGNFVTIKDILKEYPSQLVRFYILSSHYRSEIEYHDEKLDEMRRGWQRFNDCIINLAGLIDNKEIVDQELHGEEAVLADKIQKAEQEFIDAMNDDFNTALAIAVLFNLLHQVNGYIALGYHTKQADYVLAEAYRVFTTLAGDILGIIKFETRQLTGLTEPLMELILTLRTELRNQKNYQLADLIRDQLASLGIMIEDTAHGPRWKFKNDR